MMSAAMSPIADLPISMKTGRILSLSLNIKATAPQIANNGNTIIVLTKTAMCFTRVKKDVMAVCFFHFALKKTPRRVLIGAAKKT